MLEHYYSTAVILTAHIQAQVVINDMLDAGLLSCY